MSVDGRPATPAEEALLGQWTLFYEDLARRNMRSTTWFVTPRGVQAGPMREDGPEDRYDGIFFTLPNLSLAAPPDASVLPPYQVSDGYSSGLVYWAACPLHQSTNGIQSTRTG